MCEVNYEVFDELLAIEPYSLSCEKKKILLDSRIGYLTKLHYDLSDEYRRIFAASNKSEKSMYEDYKQVPFIPVRLFKERMLKSVSDDKIIKIMTSSGTSGQAVSKIYLDRTTATNQQKAMVKIVSDFTGSARMPMIIIDCPSVVKDRKKFSARGAGILGFSIFGSKKIYAFDDDMKFNLSEIREFIEKNKDRKILLFGFTFMIWQYFYKELAKIKEETGERIDLSNAILIHGGGWKKLVNDAVNPKEFHDRLHEVCGINSIHDYYGMVEQTGCIYMQCECGHLHASIFSDIIIRNPKDFSECAVGEKGIVQVLSTIPESYPGHSLLTEDEGMILGEDDCPCGRKGKYFKIFGRLKNAEIRGCSDTYVVNRGESIDEKEISADTKDNMLKKINFLVGDENILNRMPHVPVKAVFDDTVVDFLNDLSKELMTDPQAQHYADVVSLGFWLRKASISSWKKKFTYEDENLHIGRGVAFHVAPSNVPVNYAYSLFSGLLCGNANVVRIPSKEFPQILIINRVINKVLNVHPEMKDYICLVRYNRDETVNNMLSSMCNVRIIWGGDVTISELRKSELAPRATELTFADRYSLAIIDSDAYMEIEDRDKAARDFYNDTYLTDQNACTSPRIVVWTGSKRVESKEIFWKKLYELVEDKYLFQPITGVDKLSQAYLAATSTEDFGEVRLISYEGNSLLRVCVSKLSSGLMNYKGNSGYFYEYDCDDVMELRDFCDDTRCQTIAVIGDRKMIKPLLESGIKGVDRVVEVGRTMDFDLNWDGYNLVDRLTRTIVL